MSARAPSDPLVVYETRYWRVDQRGDATLPGYLIASANEPDARELDDLSVSALRELGPVLKTVTAALRMFLKPEHVYVCRFGSSPGYPVHFHIIPVYAWMKDAYRRVAGDGEAVRYPRFTDGASLTLFASEEFTRGRAPCEIPEPSVRDVVQTLRDALSHEAARSAAESDR